MAYLTQEQYEHRRANAHKRMAENAKIRTLTSEQHEWLAELCAFRHELHCDNKVLFNTEHTDYKCFWEKIEDLPYEAGKLGFDNFNAYIDIEELPSDFDYHEDDYSNQTWWIKPEDSSSWDEEEGDFIDSNDSQYKDELINSAINYVLDIAEDYNQDIENFLSEIDSKHGTKYCPTGEQRCILTF